MATAASFYWSVLLVNFSLSLGIRIAVEEEVKTKRLTEGSLAPADRALMAPAMTPGMTSLGLGESLMSEATCAMPVTPV